MCSLPARLYSHLEFLRVLYSFVLCRWVGLLSVLRSNLWMLLVNPRSIVMFVLKPIVTKFLVLRVAEENLTASRTVKVDADHAQMNVYSAFSNLKQTVDHVLLDTSCLLLYHVVYSHKGNTLMDKEAVIYVRML